MEKVLKILGVVFLVLGLVLLAPGLYLIWKYGLAFIVLPLNGTIFFAVGAGFLLRLRALAARERRLRETGQRIDADIAGVQWNTMVRVNGACPLVIQCQAVNPENGKVYVFRSKSVWYDPTPFLENRKTLPVYVDGANWRRYAVDTDGILPEQG